MTINAGQDDPIKAKETEALRIAGVLKTMLSGFKVEDINNLAAAFGKMIPGIQATSLELDMASAEIEDIARSAFGITTKKATTEAKKNIQSLMDKTEEHTGNLAKLYLRSAMKQIEIEDMKRRVVEERSKAAVGGIAGLWHEGTANIMDKMHSIFGVEIGAKMAGFAGALGIAGMAIMALQFLFDQASVGAKSFGSSWASAGGMAAKSAIEYIGMTAKIGQGYNAITEAGYTAKEASDLVQKSMTSMSWTLGWSAVQSEKYTGSLVDQTIFAADRTRELVLDMGRMSQSMFGGTEQIGKFVTLSQLYNVTTRDGIKNLSTGIGTFASTMHLDAGTAMDTINNMGTALMGTHTTIGTVAQSFVNLSQSMGKMNKTGQMSDYEMNQMAKGIEGLSSSVSTFAYMAASGKGNLEEYYETAVGTDAITKTKAIIDRFSNLKAGLASIAVSQMGIGKDLPEGMRIKMIEAFRGMSASDLKGMNQEDVATKIFGMQKGQADVYTQIASGELMGHDIMSQILGTLMKLVGIVTTGTIGLLKSTNIGQNNASIQELNKLKSDSQMATTTGSSIYRMNWTKMAGGV